MSKSITRLYEASEASRELSDMLLSSEGEVTPEMEGNFDILAQHSANLPTAIDDVLSLVREIETRAEARKAEADRLRLRAKRDEAVAAWFKAQVLRVMQSEGLKKIETERWRITVAVPGGKPAMDIFDGVPPEWCKEITETVIDRERIRAALDEGQMLPFACLVPKQPYLKVS